MNTNVLTVVAAFQAKPGKEKELRATLVGLVAPTRQEAGCLNYDLHASPEDAAKFLFHENWASNAHHEAHMKTPHLQALLPRVGELCAESPQVTMWERII